MKDNKAKPPPRFCNVCFSVLPSLGIYDENGVRIKEYTQKHTKLECHRAQSEYFPDEGNAYNIREA